MASWGRGNVCLLILAFSQRIRLCATREGVICCPVRLCILVLPSPSFSLRRQGLLVAWFKICRIRGRYMLGMYPLKFWCHASSAPMLRYYQGQSLFGLYWRAESVFDSPTTQQSTGGAVSLPRPLTRASKLRQGIHHVLRLKGKNKLGAQFLVAI